MPRDGRRKNKAPTTFGPTVLSTERALAAYSALSLEELNQIPHSWRSYYDSSYPVWKVSELEKASRLGFDAYNRARLQAVSQEQELARAQAAARAAKLDDGARVEQGEFSLGVRLDRHVDGGVASVQSAMLMRWWSSLVLELKLMR